jgi:exopolysaccharide production protein ExoY
LDESVTAPVQPVSTSTSIQDADILALQGRSAARSLEVVEGGARRFYTSIGKRGLDVALVVIALPFLLLLYLVIAAVILLLEGRPIHYTSGRMGRNGQAIRIWKFRTMSVSADSELGALLEADPALATEFSSAMKLRNDPRITSIGGFLRRSSLDELPQLLNVLKGDMSLVGPRPVLKSELEKFYGDRAGALLTFRPGLTGISQISGRSLLLYDRRVQLDLQYVRDCGFWGDMSILIRTVPNVLLCQGAF